MKKLFAVLLLLSGLLGKPDMQAQEASGASKAMIVQDEITVVGFKKLPNDITARVINPKRDQNNEICALIRVVTQNKNVYFEPDALGITARTDKPGEIWLYVPRGARRLSIMHEKYGVIRNYSYPEVIESASTYELLLYVPEERKSGEENVRIVERKATAQMFQIEFKPADAQVYVNDTLRHAIDGKLSMVLDVGQHKYRLVHPFYYTEKGTVNIVPEKPSIISVGMRLHYGKLSVKSNRKADIYVDKKLKGSTPLLLDTVLGGVRSVQARCGHLKQNKQVDVNDLESVSTSFRFRSDWFVMPQVAISSYAGKMSYGAMVGFCKRHGAYISLRSNFKPLSTDYNNYHNYSYPNENDPFFTGNTRYGIIDISAGYMMRTWRPLYIYMGIGYSDRTRACEYISENSENEWASDDDDLLPLGFEAGFIYRVNRLLFSAGCHFYGINDRCDDISGMLGIGFVF